MKVGTWNLGWGGPDGDGDGDDEDDSQTSTVEWEGKKKCWAGQWRKHWTFLAS